MVRSGYLPIPSVKKALLEQWNEIKYRTVLSRSKYLTLYRCATDEITQEVLDGLDSNMMNVINKNLDTIYIKGEIKV